MQLDVTFLLFLFPANLSFFDERCVELRRGESFPELQLLWISVNSNCCGPGEVSILLQDVHLSPFSSCTSKTIKSSFALSFLPMSQHMVGDLRLWFSPFVPLQLLDTELCSCMFFCPKGRSTFPAARHSPKRAEGGDPPAFLSLCRH